MRLNYVIKVGFFLLIYLIYLKYPVVALITFALIIGRIFIKSNSRKKGGLTKILKQNSDALWKIQEELTLLNQFLANTSELELKKGPEHNPSLFNSKVTGSFLISDNMIE